MLEIIALIFLTKNIGALAVQKGLKPGTWKLYTVLCWFGAEILGAVISVAVLGGEYLLFGVLIGLACAVASFFILRSNLNKRPDVDDEIDKIGVSDLYPERN